MLKFVWNWTGLLLPADDQNNNNERNKAALANIG